MLSEIVEDATESPAVFAEHFLNADPKEIDGRLEQKGDVISANDGDFIKGGAMVYRSLWEAVTNSDTTVLIIVNSQTRAKLAINDIGNVIPTVVADSIERETKTDIQFDNGSMIVASGVGRNGERIRGYSPDMCAINNHAPSVTDEIIDEVILPQIRWSSVWLRGNPRSRDNLTDHVLQEGAYVKKE